MNNINNNAGEIENNPTKTLVATAHTAGAEDALGVTENCYGKFKDLNGLLNAYNSLQSEFTRRSQKVKELEREISLLKEDKSKLEPSFSKEEWEKLAFLEIFPNCEEDYESLLDTAAISGDDSKGRIGRAFLDKVKSDYSKESNYLKSKEYLIDAISKNEELKSDIIKKYLQEVHGSKPIVTLTSGNGKATITPPSKPISIAEAGNIARQIFEKHKENINL